MASLIFVSSPLSAQSFVKLRTNSNYSHSPCYISREKNSYIHLPYNNISHIDSSKSLFLKGDSNFSFSSPKFPRVASTNSPSLNIIKAYTENENVYRFYAHDVVYANDALWNFPRRDFEKYEHQEFEKFVVDGTGKPVLHFPWFTGETAPKSKNQTKPGEYPVDEYYRGKPTGNPFLDIPNEIKSAIDESKNETKPGEYPGDEYYKGRPIGNPLSDIPNEIKPAIDESKNETKPGEYPGDEYYRRRPTGNPLSDIPNEIKPAVDESKNEIKPAVDESKNETKPGEYPGDEYYRGKPT